MNFVKKNALSNRYKLDLLNHNGIILPTGDIC